MKISFNIKKLLKKKKSSKPKRDFQPERDWTVILATFIVCTLLATAVAGFNLWQIKQGTFFQDADQSGGVNDPIDMELLNSVLSRFEEKAQKLEEYKTNSPETFDPSL